MRQRILKGITRNVLLLGIVSMFTDVSSQMVFPLLPLFLTSVLGAGASAVGIVEGAAEATASLLKVCSGYWSDRIKRRKPFVLFGYSLSSLAKPLFAFATGWVFVLFVRIAERLGKGIRDATRDAMVAESTGRRFRGEAYGFQRALDGLGSVLGAVLAFIFLPLLGYKRIFLIAFIPAIIAVLFIFPVREKKRKAASETTLKIGFKQLSWNLKFFIIISSIFTLGQFGYAFLILKAKNIGLTDEKAILLYVLFYIAYTVCIIPAGVLSDRAGRKPVLVAGYAIFAALSMGLLFVSSLYSLLAFFVMYGIFFALIDGIQRAFVADLAPKHLKATALGTFYTAIGFVALPGGLIAGMLWDKISPQATFIYGFIMAVLALVMFTFVKEERK